MDKFRESEGILRGIRWESVKKENRGDEIFKKFNGILIKINCC